MWIVLAACEPSPSTPGEPNPEPVISTRPCDPVTLPDPRITEAAVGCESGQLTVSVSTTSWTGTGRLLVAQGAADPAVVELQPVESTTWDECGAWDQLDLVLRSTGASWAMGSATAFTCEEYTAPDTLTFGLWVTSWEEEDAVADCWAWGPDVDGILDGSFADLLPEGLAPSDLSGCELP
jgi:hypothetical protein